MIPLELDEGAVAAAAAAAGEGPAGTKPPRKRGRESRESRETRETKEVSKESRESKAANFKPAVGKRIAVWNKISRLKVSGNAAPTEASLRDYLAARPNYGPHSPWGAANQRTRLFTPPWGPTLSTARFQKRVSPSSPPGARTTKTSAHRSAPRGALAEWTGQCPPRPRTQTTPRQPGCFA